MTKISETEYDCLMEGFSRIHRDTLSAFDEYARTVGSLLSKGGGFSDILVTGSVRKMMGTFCTDAVPLIAGAFEASEKEMSEYSSKISGSDNERRSEAVWEG